MLSEFLFALSACYVMPPTLLGPHSDKISIPCAFKHFGHVALYKTRHVQYLLLVPKYI